MPPVLPVADARAGLSEILRRFRVSADAEPVTIGSHRKPEAVLVPFAQFRPVEDRTNRPEDPLEFLRSRAALVERLAGFSKLRDVAVFGSVARGESGVDSDIDLLVTPDDDASLFDFAQFEIDMEQLTGRTVDVVSRRGLDPRRDAGILAEAVPL